MNEDASTPLPHAGLARRLMALLYDVFLLAALWFVTAGVFVLIYPHTGLPVVETNGVETAPKVWLQGLLFPLLVIETWGFYAWFWLHGGQTLGMRAWRLQAQRVNGGPLTPLQTAQRFLVGILSWLLLGTGWLMALIPPRETLHDRLSGTQTVVRPKVKKG